MTELQIAKNVLLKNCPRAARDLVRNGHHLLTEKIIMKLSRRSPERQRDEFEKLLAGERPFAAKSTVFDTRNYAKVENRVARSAGWINKAVQVTAFFADQVTISDDVQESVGTSIASCRKELLQLGKLVRRDYKKGRFAEIPPQNPAMNWNPTRIWKKKQLTKVGVRAVPGMLGWALGFVAKCVRDLTNRPGFDFPSKPQKVGLCKKLDECLDQLRELASMLDKRNPL